MQRALLKKKKSKYFRFVSQFSQLPESSGSIFTALVSSAKFDFKLPEVKEGLYSINTRSSHTFLKLLHSLLSKITILSGAGRLQLQRQRWTEDVFIPPPLSAPLHRRLLPGRCNKREPQTWKISLHPGSVQDLAPTPSSWGQPPTLLLWSSSDTDFGVPSLKPLPKLLAPVCNPEMSQSPIDSFSSQISHLRS